MQMQVAAVEMYICLYAGCGDGLEGSDVDVLFALDRRFLVKSTRCSISTGLS